MSSKLQSKYKEWRLHALLWLFVICFWGVLLFLRGEHNKEVEKRNQIRLMGCTGGLGKVATSSNRVCVFYSEELFYRFDKHLLGSLIGEGIRKEDVESLVQFRKLQDEFIKLLDDGKVYFSIANDTPVKFLERSKRVKPSIHISILEGHYKGMTGWIEAEDYYCLDWETPKNNGSFRSTHEIKEGLIRSRLSH